MSIAELEGQLVGPTVPTGGLWHEAWRRLRHDRGAIVGFIFVCCFVAAAILAPIIAPYSPLDQNLGLITKGCCPGPSSTHWFGVDQLGRDELSRILWGARYSLDHRRRLGHRRALDRRRRSARSRATSAARSTT